MNENGDAIANAFSGDLDYTARQEIVEKFMANEIKILIATDVCARSSFGSPNIAVVINFEPPYGPNRTINKKLYLLRTGRGGQFGRLYAILLLFKHIYVYRRIMKINLFTFFRSKSIGG